MPISALDPTVALIVVDLQTSSLSIAGRPHALTDVVSRSAALAAAFRRHNLPVVLVRVGGAPPGRRNYVRPQGHARSADANDFLPELDQQPEDLVIEKRAWSAFSNPMLAARLTERGVTQVVITGCASSIGVDSTARDAYRLGYNVVVVTDAITDGLAAAHEVCLSHIFPRLGEIGLTEEALALLGART